MDRKNSIHEDMLTIEDSNDKKVVKQLMKVYHKINKKKKKKKNQVLLVQVIYHHFQLLVNVNHYQQDFRKVDLVVKVLLVVDYKESIVVVMMQVKINLIEIIKNVKIIE